MRLLSVQLLLVGSFLHATTCLSDTIQLKSCWANLPQGYVELTYSGNTIPLSPYGGAFGETLIIERPKFLELKFTDSNSKKTISQKINSPTTGTEFRLVISGNSLETSHGWLIPTEAAQFPWGSMLFVNATNEMGHFYFDNDKAEINHDEFHLMPFIATKRNGIYLGIERLFKNKWVIDYSTKIVIHPLQRMIMVYGPKEVTDQQVPLSLVMEFKPAPVVLPLIPNQPATSP
jgi:hypothetical protein